MDYNQLNESEKIKIGEEQTFTFQISPSDLPDCTDSLLSILNCENNRSGMEIEGMVADLIKDSFQHLDIRVGFKLFTEEEIQIEDDRLSCMGVSFFCQATIARQLDGSTGLALFAVTLGAEYDTWSRDFFSQDEPFCAYVADLIGSVQADQAADWLENTLVTQMASENLRCTNRFSPGYCGWDVFEQHKLFSLLARQFLGIELTASALMTPLKSISGIIGIGEQVEKLPYTCEYCEQENCFMRRGKPG